MKGHRKECSRSCYSTDLSGRAGPTNQARSKAVHDFHVGIHVRAGKGGVRIIQSGGRLQARKLSTVHTFYRSHHSFMIATPDLRRLGPGCSLPTGSARIARTCLLLLEKVLRSRIGYGLDGNRFIVQRIRSIRYGESQLPCTVEQGSQNHQESSPRHFLASFPYQFMRARKTRIDDGKERRDRAELQHSFVEQRGKQIYFLPPLERTDSCSTVPDSKL